MPAHSNARSRTWTRRTALPAQAPGGQRSGASCSARLPAPPLAREHLTSGLDSCRTTCSPLTRYAVPPVAWEDHVARGLHVASQRRAVAVVRRPARRHLVLPRPRRRLHAWGAASSALRMARTRLVIHSERGHPRVGGPVRRGAACESGGSHLRISPRLPRACVARTANRCSNWPSNTTLFLVAHDSSTHS
jgi:hypothetical protein